MSDIIEMPRFKIIIGLVRIQCDSQETTDASRIVETDENGTQCNIEMYLKDENPISFSNFKAAINDLFGLNLNEKLFTILTILMNKPLGSEYAEVFLILRPDSIMAILTADNLQQYVFATSYLVIKYVSFLSLVITEFISEDHEALFDSGHRVDYETYNEMPNLVRVGVADMYLCILRYTISDGVCIQVTKFDAIETEETSCDLVMFYYKKLINKELNILDERIYLVKEGEF